MSRAAPRGEADALESVGFRVRLIYAESHVSGGHKMLWISRTLGAGSRAGWVPAKRRRRSPPGALLDDRSVAIKVWHIDCVARRWGRSTEEAIASGSGWRRYSPRTPETRIDIVKGDANFLRDRLFTERMVETVAVDRTVDWGDQNGI